MENNQKYTITLLFIIFIVHLITMTVSAEVTIDPPMPYEEVAKNANGRASDVLDIAYTQEDYVGIIEDGRRYSWFGNVWNPELSERNANSAGNWCSEFVSWCLVTAKVPGAKPLISVEAFREAYSDSMYRMYASAQNSTEIRKEISDRWFDGYVSQGTLRLRDLKRGDILLICRDGNEDRGEPHHTAIFDYYEGNTVYVVDGNIKVRDSNYSKVRVGGRYEAHEVIAVLRPPYAD